MPRSVNILFIGLAIVVVMSPTMTEGSEPKVRVEQGELLGRLVTSQETGKAFYSFQGIPYARPPLDELRFRDAVPPGPWRGTLNATKPASMCVQIMIGAPDPDGSEDCLYLNVYTPQLPRAQSSPLPVMFFIHGGAFKLGSGSDDVYGPDFIVAEGVVLVTINYRLSCFGFLFLRNAAPGNVGLKDQLAALRWVNKNIAAFNGDPKQITVFGHSAGAAAVHWFTLSPLTKGLFQRAIAESGSVLSPWGKMVAPYETSKRLANAVGCTGGSDESVLQCLRTVDSGDLIRAAETLGLTERERGRLLYFPFVPTVEERQVWGVETFVTAPPEQLLLNGCQRDMPYLTGFSEAEWMIDVIPDNTLFSTEEKLRKLDSDWKKHIFPETRLPENLDSWSIFEAMEDLRKFYLNGSPLTFENLQGYKNMITDLQFAEGVLYGAKYRAELQKSPVYLYHFTVDDQLNYLKRQWNLTTPGTGHDDEVGYLFKVKFLPKVSANSSAALARSRMVRMWTNFAKTGRPIPMEDSLLDAEWKTFDSDKREYLEIGANLEAGNNLHKSISEFYEGFYRKYGTRGENGRFHRFRSSLLKPLETYSFGLFF